MSISTTKRLALGLPNVEEDIASIVVHDIGVPFPVFEHLGDVAPTNDGNVKYVKLSAGLTGVGGYNEGLLINEDVSGSAPLVEATAEIAVGPLTGQTVYLVNSMEAVLRPREVSGELQLDQMQRITGRLGGNRIRHMTENINGMVTAHVSTGGTAEVSGSGGNRSYFTLDSAGSPNARVSSTTDGETRPKNVSVTEYMRIV
jgi:hypothetical protein